MKIKYLYISLEIWGGIFCLIACLCIFLSNNIKKKSNRFLMYMQLSNCILLFSDAIAWGFRGKTSTLGYYMVRISNFAVFILGYVLMLLITKYVYYQIPKQERKNIYNMIVSLYILSALAIVTTIISQFNHMYYYFDENNYYCRNNLFWISQVFGIVGMALILILLIKCRNLLRRNNFISLISYIIFPLIAMVIQIFIYGIPLLNMAITISLLLIFITTLIEQSKILLEQEKKLNDMRIKIMISQISPHFLFNSLTTIKYFCRTDPKIAVETVDEFASFLRSNLDALSTKDCVPFEQEIEHIENYIALEKKRFGDKVNIIMNIQEIDFDVPVLTLQPLVENAIKHGITKKIEGGTIIISTKILDDNYIINIQDNGVGFDTSHKKDDGKTHIGIENTRNRLESMCDGSLEITSNIGVGTLVTITIPVKS